MRSKKLLSRQVKVEQYIQNSNTSARQIASDLKLGPRTVSGVVRRFKECQSIHRKEGSGSYIRPANPALRRKIVKSANDNPALSDNEQAIQYGTSKSTRRKS